MTEEDLYKQPNYLCVNLHILFVALKHSRLLWGIFVYFLFCSLRSHSSKHDSVPSKFHPCYLKVCSSVYDMNKIEKKWAGKVNDQYKLHYSLLRTFFFLRVNESRQAKRIYSRERKVSLMWNRKYRKREI